MASFPNDIKGTLIKSALIGCAAVGLYALNALATSVEESGELPPAATPNTDQTIESVFEELKKELRAGFPHNPPTQDGYLAKDFMV